MRILQVHNRYYSGTGGEDAVLAQELDLLRSHGHTVTQLIVSSADELQNAGLVKLINTWTTAVWSKRGYKATQEAIRNTSCDIVHVHNAFPLLSPSVFWAAKAMKVPVVTTLHNYRYVCAGALFYRDGHICEDCIGRAPWPALLHNCYKDSLPITSSIAAIQVVHRALSTFENKVDGYIALTEFARQQFIKSGLPGEKIHVKPNFVDGCPTSTPLEKRPYQIAFAGQIVSAKGIDLLLKVWNSMDKKGWRLVVMGQGPDEERLRAQYTVDGVEWLGQVPRERSLEILGESRYCVLPSRWFEGFPMVLVEGFARKTPAIVPDHGSFAEIVREGRDGIVVHDLSESNLRRGLESAMTLSGEEWLRYSNSAYERTRSEYSPEENHNILLDIYRKVIRQSHTASA